MGMSGLSQPALTAITPIIRTPAHLTAIGDRATLSAAGLSAPVPGITAGAMATTDMATTAVQVTDILAGATGIGPAMLTEAVTMVTLAVDSTAMRAVDSTVAAVITVVVGFTEAAARTEAVATAEESFEITRTPGLVTRAFLFVACA